MASNQPGVSRSAKAADSHKGVAFESLDQFGEVMWTQFRRRCIAMVDKRWFQFIHENPSRNFSSLRPEFNRLANVDEIRQSHPCTQLFDKVAKLLIKGSPTAFMAPMCSPLTKQKIAKLVDPAAEYFVNEKSDGLRVVFVSQRVESFPTWRFANGVKISLYDTGLLEEARLQIQDTSNKRSESSDMQLTFGGHTMASVGEPGSKVESFQLTLTRPPANSPAQAGATCVVQRDLCDRHFSYLFDRRVNSAYLLFDEYPFPNLDSVVLDGELTVTLPDPRGIRQAQIGVFDMFQFVPLVEEEGTRAADLSPPDMQRWLMMERYDAIGGKALGPLAATAGRFPFAVQIFRKDMFPLQELPRMMQRIKKVGDEYVFNGTTLNDGIIFTPNAFDLYSGSHDDQFKWKWHDKLSVDWRLTPIGMLKNVPRGLAKKDNYQVESFFKKLRFKAADISGHTHISRSVYFLNPHKMKIGPETIVEATFDGIRNLWKMQKVRADKTDANSVVTMLSVVESIAECLDSESLCELLHLWDDDAEAQAAFRIEGATPVGSAAAGSTEEGNATNNASGAPADAPAATSAPGGGVEMMDFDDDDGPQRNSGARKPANAEAANGKDGVERKTYETCNFILKLQQGWHSSNKMVLQWQCTLPNERNPITCNHVDVRECFGLGETCPAEDPENSRLEGKLAIALANAGGCSAWSDLTVEAYFDPQRGRWGIGSLGENKKSTYASLVLRHLEVVAKYSNRKLPLPQLEGAHCRDAIARAEEREADPEHHDTNDHYAVVTQNLKERGNERSSLRQFNNWVKSVLIQTSIDSIGVLRGLDSNDRKIAVLDLCSGRGGDLQKWKAQKLQCLMCVDSCFEAVVEGASRYSLGEGLSTKVTKNHKGHPGIPAHFDVFDCFDPELSNRISAQKEAWQLSETGFDLVSCQFSMHYAFGDAAQVRGFLHNVSAALRPGGTFLATTVDCEAIDHWRESKGNDFGNSVFHVTLLEEGDGQAAKEDQNGTRFGAPYRFSLEQSVADEVEYIVDLDAFTTLAEEEFGLRMIETMNFEEFKETYEDTPAGQRLKEVVVGGKREEDGSAKPLSLTDDEREAAFLYRTIVMEKME